MSRKIAPSAKAKRTFFLHCIVFAVATVAMLLIHRSQTAAAGTWVYPWYAWPVAAWGLAIIGHWCALWTNYEDKGLVEYERQARNG